MELWKAMEADQADVGWMTPVPNFTEAEKPRALQTMVTVVQNSS